MCVWITKDTLSEAMERGKVDFDLSGGRFGEMPVQEQAAMPGTVSTTQDDGAVDEEQVNVSRVVCNSVFFLLRI